LPADVPPAAAGSRYAVPGYYILHFGPINERPTQFNWTYRHHLFKDVHWSSWGPDGAQGTGTEVVSACDCTQGPWFEGPVQIHASNPQPPPPDAHGCATDVLFYTDVVIVYPDTAPPQFTSTDLNWTTDNGKPAAHYVNHQPTCDQ
jgi:hypothetical protein